MSTIPEHTQQSNWKVAVDNYLEGYHVPVAHPGLMRLLDYKRYSVETTDAYVVYDAPLREKASDNWAERLYQRLVRPMPGLIDEDHRIFRYIAIYPNTVIDLYPDHVLLWKMNPQAVWTRSTCPGHTLRRKDCDLRTRIAQKLNLYVSKITNARGRRPGQRMQIGLGNTDFQPGPLSLRERGVAWFAARIRADLGDLDEEIGR